MTATRQDDGAVIDEQSTTLAVHDARSPASVPGDALVLAESTDPKSVFASLAEQCTPRWCDRCTVGLTDDGSWCQIDDPATEVAGAAVDPGPWFTIHVPFSSHRRALSPDHQLGGPNHANPSTVQIVTDGRPFDGVAQFSWRQQFSQRDALGVALLVEHAVQAIARANSDAATRMAEGRIAHLETALVNSRSIGAAIGIIMGLGKITELQAFELLRTASQHSQRKIRDLAQEVIDTGWLDPELLPVDSPAASTG